LTIPISPIPSLFSIHHSSPLFPIRHFLFSIRYFISLGEALPFEISNLKSEVFIALAPPPLPPISVESAISSPFSLFAPVQKPKRIRLHGGDSVRDKPGRANHLTCAT